MALTTNDKIILLNALLAHLDELNNQFFTLKEIGEMLEKEVGFEPQSASLTHAFKKALAIREEYALCSEKRKGSTRLYYKLCQWEYVYDRTFTKDKNILILARPKQEGGKPFTYDFITGTFSDEMDKIEFADRLKEIVLPLLKYEWLFNYISEDVELYNISRLKKEVYEKCPKGFINFLQETNQTLNKNILNKYYYKQKYGVVGYNLRNTLGELITEKLINYNILNDFMKVIHNDIKNGCLCDVWDYRNFANLIFQVKILFNDYKIDTNKDSSHNIHNLKNLIQENEKELLEIQMKKLNFINGLTFENLVVVVPQTAEEKIVEGQQQNNCVGHYYDNSIKSGKNFIYFIRKLSDINSSYVTCRYNVEDEQTKEARIKNNCYLSDDKANNFIRKIDRIITENKDKLK